VDQFTRLLLDGGDHIGMAMSGRGHRNARRKIEELVAIDVLDNNAAAAFRNQRIGARVGRRNDLVIARDDALGVGARNRSLKLGAGGQCLGGRGSSPETSGW